MGPKGLIVRPGVEVEVHPELYHVRLYVESWKAGYWPNSVENQLIEVTGQQTLHKLPVNQISACQQELRYW